MNEVTHHHVLTAGWQEILPGVEMRLAAVAVSRGIAVEVRFADMETVRAIYRYDPEGIYPVKELLGSHEVRLPKNPGEGVSQ